MTLGLSQITNDAEATTLFLAKYGKYFDKWFITVADKNKAEYEKLKGRMRKDDVLTYFKTPPKPEDLDFSAARNFNIESIDTDYWFWADSDDDIVNPENIRGLMGESDVVQLNYDYAQNVNGEAISDHIRERLIKRSYEGHWDAPVHETFQGPPALWEQSDLVTVKHNKDQAGVNQSVRRNELILKKHWQDTKDPRDAMYLGMIAISKGEYEQGVAWLTSHIQTSGSDQDIYRSWCKVAECEWLMGKHEQALYATDEAVKMQPSWPDAYYVKVIILGSQEKYDDAIEWLKVASAKPAPETLSIVDPTLYKYRGLANGAQCYLFSGRVKEAYRLYQYVKEQNPKFWEDMSKDDEVNWETVFEQAYFDQKAIDSLRWLLHYTKGEGGKPEKLFESLPPRIFSDIRLSPDRNKFLPIKKWPKKSIVFYCGQGNEPWGPEFLKDGCGGSEEAVIYLSRELAKLGWDVTVYNEREEEYQEEFYLDEIKRQTFVTYKPWTLFNPNDEFDVFVGWRLAGLTRDIKARVRATDMHDTPLGHATITSSAVENTDKFFFKSKFQADIADKVPKNKKVIVGNGIIPTQFA